LKTLSAPQTIARPASASSIVKTGGSGSISTVTRRRASSARAPIAMGDQRDRFLAVVHHLVREVRLIVGDQRHDVPAGNVGGGDNDAPRPRGSRDRSGWP
jgi:hypothetical protein